MQKCLVDPECMSCYIMSHTHVLVLLIEVVWICKYCPARRGRRHASTHVAILPCTKQYQQWIASSVTSSLIRLSTAIKIKSFIFGTYYCLMKLCS